jgi:hypothetical protein
VHQDNVEDFSRARFLGYLVVQSPQRCDRACFSPGDQLDAGR